MKNYVMDVRVNLTMAVKARDEADARQKIQAYIDEFEPDTHSDRFDEVATIAVSVEGDFDLVSVDGEGAE